MSPKEVEFIFDSYKLQEDKLINILAILPFSKENESAWSPELVSIFVETGNLLDSISRTLMGGSNTYNITHFENRLFRPLDILNTNIVIYSYPLQIITPFRNYRDISSNGWWLIYNELKHNRIEHFRKANLVNTITALGALFLLITRYKSEEYSRALFRRQWTKANGIVPEYVHTERLSYPSMFWCDSSLFGGCDDSTCIPADLSTINPTLASKKFQRYFGRFNP